MTKTAPQQMAALVLLALLAVAPLAAVDACSPSSVKVAFAAQHTAKALKPGAYDAADVEAHFAAQPTPPYLSNTATTFSCIDDRIGVRDSLATLSTPGEGI